MMPKNVLTGASVALACAVVLTGCGSQRMTVEQSRSYVLAGSVLKVDVDSGDVEVQSDDVDRVQVTRWFNGGPEDASWTMDSDELLLREDCGFLFSCDIRYRIVVPLETEVIVEAQSGDIEATDFATALEITAENGDIEVSDISGDLILTSVNGEVSGSSLTSTIVEATTLNGDIDLSFNAVPRQTEVSSESGEVTVSVPTGDYAIDLSTESGDIDSDIVKAPTPTPADESEDAETSEGEDEPTAEDEPTEAADESEESTEENPGDVLIGHIVEVPDSDNTIVISTDDGDINLRIIEPVVPEDDTGETTDESQ